MNHIEANQYIKATLVAFGPNEAINLAQDTWAKLHEAMRVLIEQPADEPVAEPTEDMVLALRGASGFCTEDAIYALRDVLAVMPLYTRPQPAAQWVGLTDEEIEREWQFQHDEEGNPPDQHDFAYAIEQALKDKNT